MLKNSLEIVKKAHFLVNSKTKWEYEIINEDSIIIFKNGKKFSSQQHLF